tara:strand:- start:1498 stop:3255 length:1758 start_codon:yes stop_codon:yes gene_type:complete
MKKNIKNIQEIKGAKYHKWTKSGALEVVEEMDDNRFFSIVKRIVEETFFEKLKDYINPDEFYRRDEFIEGFTKLYGLGQSEFTGYPDSLQHVIFWAALDNWTGITNGRITNFEQLEIRPLKKYKISMKSDETEYVDYRWDIELQGYNESDVGQIVIENEDGLYDWWEYENDPGFSREVVDSGERQDWGVEEIKEIGKSSTPPITDLKENWWEEETMDKWSLLEKDMREAMDKIIEDHKPNWGNDQYNVMGAIEEIMENLFQKVPIRESFMSNPQVAKYFENKEILKYLKGKDRELVSDAVEMLRGWGRFNPIMTDLSPFLTDTRENLKGEYSREILDWATENESFPPDYDQFFEELDREEVTWLWENGQDIRDALTRSAILLAQETDGGRSMSILNKIFKEFASKTYRFILTGEWLEDAQTRRNADPDQDAMDAIMVDAPDGLTEHYEERDGVKYWSSDYVDLETDNKEDYLTELFTKLHYNLMHDEETWSTDGNDHDLLYLLTQEMDDIIQDLEYNQEHKTADKLEKIVSPLWDYEDEIKEAMDKHRKILLKVIQDLKDLVKIYGIKGIPRDIKYRTPGQGREL